MNKSMKINPSVTVLDISNEYEMSIFLKKETSKLHPTKSLSEACAPCYFSQKPYKE